MSLVIRMNSRKWTSEQLDQAQRDAAFENASEKWILDVLTRAFGKDVRRNLECHRRVSMEELPPNSIVLPIVGVSDSLVREFMERCNVVGVSYKSRESSIWAYSGPELGNNWREATYRTKSVATDLWPEPLTGAESSDSRPARLENCLERIEKLLENLAVDASFAPGGQTATDAAASFKKAAIETTSVTPL